MKYFDQLVFRCNSCNERLQWGDKVCASCETGVMEGLPIWIDKLLGFIIYSVIILVLFLLISVATANLFDAKIPIAIRLVVAFFIAQTQLKIAPGMGVNPRHARVRLDISRFVDEESGSAKRFDFHPEKWGQKDLEGDIYDLLIDGATSMGDLAELLGYFPGDRAVSGIQEIIKNAEDATTMARGIRSLVRIGNQKAKEILWNLKPDKVRHLLEESEVLADADKRRLKAIMDERPDAENGA